MIVKKSKQYIVFDNVLKTITVYNIIAVIVPYNYFLTTLLWDVGVCTQKRHLYSILA